MFTRKKIVFAIASVVAMGIGAAHAGSLKLEETPYPELTEFGDSEGHQVLSTEAAKFKGKWEQTGFTTLLRSGDELAGQVAQGRGGSDHLSSHGSSARRGGTLFDGSEP